MTKILSFLPLLFIFLTISFFKSQNLSNDNKIITVSYLGDVEGYSVKAYWMPNKVSYNHVVGPAIIEFKNKSSYFTVTNNNFSLLKSRLPFTFSDDGFQIIKVNKTDLSLVYDYNIPISDFPFGRTNESFFFQDVDFDNKKELLIAEVNNGQRGVATFKAYKFEDGELESEMYGITNKSPFNALDQMSKLDLKNKKILIYGSGGSCGSASEIYKVVQSKNEYDSNKYVLDSVVEEVRDDQQNKCFEHTYKINDNSRQLVSKKEMK